MNNNRPKRAIIADDHPAVVKGIKSYLERDGLFDVVATANSTLELAEVLDTVPCDFAFVDIGMQGLDGESNSIRFLRRLSWQKARPKIIVITMISQGQMLAGLVKLGIDGVVDKRDGLACLYEAVVITEKGRRYLSPSARKAIAEFPETSPARAGALSKREWEVFRLYANGLLVDDIAERFGRSRKTIATQKRSGMRKLGIESDTQLVEYMRQVGLI
jgi:two-component system, NarL family, captular synthesis response regulator RcsB